MTFLLEETIEEYPKEREWGGGGLLSSLEGTLLRVPHLLSGDEEGR